MSQIFGALRKFESRMFRVKNTVSRALQFCFALQTLFVGLYNFVSRYKHCL